MLGHSLSREGAKDTLQRRFTRRWRLSAQGEMKANFLRHEGFLGAVGAFLKVHPMAPTSAATTQGGREPRKVRCALRLRLRLRSIYTRVLRQGLALGRWFATRVAQDPELLAEWGLVSR